MPLLELLVTPSVWQELLRSVPRAGDGGAEPRGARTQGGEAQGGEDSGGLAGPWLGPLRPGPNGCRGGHV